MYHWDVVFLCVDDGEGADEFPPSTPVLLGGVQILSMPAKRQVHLSSLSSQMAVMGQSLQQVELQLRMQQKQHEDVMKILVHRLAVAPQDRLLAAAA